MSPHLDPAAVSELVIEIFRWWALTVRGWSPLLLYPLGLHPIASRKVSKISQWAWQGEGGSWWLGDLTFLPQRQVLNFLAYVT